MFKQILSSLTNLIFITEIADCNLLILRWFMSDKTTNQLLYENSTLSFLYVLLAVHLSIILAIDRRNAQILVL